MLNIPLHALPLAITKEKFNSLDMAFLWRFGLKDNQLMSHRSLPIFPTAPQEVGVHLLRIFGNTVSLCLEVQLFAPESNRGPHVSLADEHIFSYTSQLCARYPCMNGSGKSKSNYIWLLSREQNHLWPCRLFNSIFCESEKTNREVKVWCVCGWTHNPLPSIKLCRESFQMLLYGLI